MPVNENHSDSVRRTSWQNNECNYKWGTDLTIKLKWANHFRFPFCFADYLRNPQFFLSILRRLGRGVELLVIRRPHGPRRRRFWISKRLGHPHRQISRQNFGTQRTGDVTLGLWRRRLRVHRWRRSPSCRVDLQIKIELKKYVSGYHFVKNQGCNKN